VNRSSFWINLAFFQAAWPACVIGAGYGVVWPSLVLVGTFAFWQLGGGRAHPVDGPTVLLFATTGVALDTLWLQLGIVNYALQWPLPGAAPFWLLLLWVALGLSVNHCLSVFRERWRIWIALASVGSPLSYAAAAEFGAVAWTAPAWQIVLCMGPAWALAVGLLFRQAGRWSDAAGRSQWALARQEGK